MLYNVCVISTVVEGGDVQSTKPVSGLKNVCDITILGREFAGLLQHQSGHGAQPPAEGKGRQEEVEEVIPYHPPPLLLLLQTLIHQDCFRLNMHR